MERPDTRVVSLELDDNIGWNGWASWWESGLLKDLGITTSWVGWVGDDAVPNTGAFSENLEIVAVEMLDIVR
jgi:hypothetical protein